MSGGRGPLAAAVLALLVWLPSIRGGFLYDDRPTILDNRGIRDLGALGAILRSEPARPLLNLTWALNYAVSGARPWSYHLVNVAIHAGNAALIASLFLWMARRSGRPHPENSAVLAAALFAVTPMAAETVAYVSSRSTALAALFMLSSLRLAVRDLAEERRPLSALGCFVLALLTKEDAAALPLLLVALDYFFLAHRSWLDLRRRLPFHAAFVALPGLGLLLRRLAVGHWLPPPALDPAIYALTQLAAFPLYLGRALVPLDPAFYRGHPPSAWPPDALTAAGLLATLALFGLAARGRHRRPEASFAILWMAAALVPSSSIVALKEMVVDHRAYLGGAGVLYLAGGWLWAPGRTAFAAALIALLASRSVQYQTVLADPVRAWGEAASRAPGSAEARLGLAEALAAAGDPQAEDELRVAALLAPADPRSWTNLGTLLIQKQRWEEAEAPLRRAAALAPQDARVRDNLAAALLGLGREDEAVAELEAALAGRPVLAQPRIRLAGIVLKRGEKARAARLVAEAARLEIDEEDGRAIAALQGKLAE